MAPVVQLSEDRNRIAIMEVIDQGNWHSIEAIQSDYGKKRGSWC